MNHPDVQKLDDAQLKRKIGNIKKLRKTQAIDENTVKPIINIYK